MLETRYPDIHLPPASQPRSRKHTNVSSPKQYGERLFDAFYRDAREDAFG